MDSMTLRVICGLLAVLFGGLLFVRRRQRKAD